jgi:hypothetical protein
MAHTSGQNSSLQFIGGANTEKQYHAPASTPAIKATTTPSKLGSLIQFHDTSALSLRWQYLLFLAAFSLATTNPQRSYLLAENSFRMLTASSDINQLRRSGLR